ncbi:MAG: hypothetical protein ACRCWM_05755 [Sarcina sp.]
MSIKYKTVQVVRNFTYKKKEGSLLLELVVGFAVASIMLLCVWSSFNTAMNVDTKALEKEESYKVLYALEKEFNRNVSFDGVLPLVGSSNLCVDSIPIGNLLDLGFIEEKLGSIENVYLNIYKMDDEEVKIEILKEDYKVEVSKFKCVGVR